MGRNLKRVLVLKHPADLSLVDEGHKGRKSVVSVGFFVCCFLVFCFFSLCFFTCSLPPVSLFYLEDLYPYLHQYAHQTKNA